MRTQEIVEAYGKTHIYMIGMDDNPQPKPVSYTHLTLPTTPYV